MIITSCSEYVHFTSLENVSLLHHYCVSLHHYYKGPLLPNITHFRPWILQKFTHFLTRCPFFPLTSPPPFTPSLSPSLPQPVPSLSPSLPLSLSPSLSLPPSPSLSLERVSKPGARARRQHSTGTGWEDAILHICVCLYIYAIMSMHLYTKCMYIYIRAPARHPAMVAPV